MITRRRVIAGSLGSLLMATAGAGRATVSSEAPADELIALPGKKPLIGRTFRPPNFETPLADLRQPFTANEAFFVRYHVALIPEIDPRAWRLTIGGASTKRPLELSLDELQRGFERVSIAAVNQCSGNRRGLFTPRVPGVQWGDDGQSWQQAALDEDLGAFAWRGFRSPIDTSRPGQVTLQVRATARSGAQQPKQLTPNPSGYHHNAIQRIALEVA